MTENYKFETNSIHYGYQPDPTSLSTTPPIYRTSAYHFKDTGHAADLFALKELGNIYTRLTNTTQATLESRLAKIEGGKAAIALASGTAGIFYTIINICSAGEEIISANNLYGGTFTMFNNILPQLGIKTNFVNFDDLDAFKNSINEKTRAIYIETIGNPTLDVTDISAIADIAHNNGLPLIVDSTFSTPYLLKPIQYGADIVIHSLSKWIGGHGTAIGGAVIDSGNFNWKNDKFNLYNEPDGSYHDIRWAHDLGQFNDIAFAMRMRTVPLRNLGACISPDNAWIFLQGLETLHVRMDRHCENALKVAKYLSEHPGATWVRYPGLKEDPAYPVASKYLEKGFGGMVVFGIKGGKEAGQKFINNLKLFSHVANVGDTKSLAIHPGSTTHSQLTEEQQISSGLKPELIRLSIGIENVDDIIADINQALGKT